jgi:hypothetical protein
MWPMENPTKETVIIVHGTWAAPKDDDPDQAGPKPDQPDHVSWYEIPDDPEHQPNFVSKLDKELEKSGSPARCWAHCKDNSKIFSWSGKNAWIDRTHASFALAAYINKLQADGWQCHVVAHSHGGNVVAEALPAIIQTTDQPTGIGGTITTLGAPFIDAMSPIDEKRERRGKFLNVLLWLFYLPFATLLLWMAYLNSNNTALVTLSGWLFFGIPALVPGISFLLLRRKKEVGWREYWKSFEKQKSLRAFILSMSSPMDEAWQLLYHIRDIENPVAPKSGLISYLWESRKTYISRSSDIARIQGSALFLDQTILVKICVLAMWSIGLWLTYWYYYWAGFVMFFNMTWQDQNHDFLAIYSY